MWYRDNLCAQWLDPVQRAPSLSPSPSLALVLLNSWDSGQSVSSVISHILYISCHPRHRQKIHSYINTTTCLFYKDTLHIVRNCFLSLTIQILQEEIKSGYQLSLNHMSCQHLANTKHFSLVKAT